MSGEERPKLLLVEGVDDEQVVSQIRHKNDHLPGFCVKNTDGVQGILRLIAPELKEPERSVLGIMVDANDDPSGRWQSTIDRLRRLDIQAPNQPSPGGVIIDASIDLKVGIWMMPDNETPGELEDFVREMIPTSDPVWPRAVEYIDVIPDVDRKFSAAKTLRAQVYAWLAARSRPRNMGTAIRAGDLDDTVPLAVQFVDWLDRLFR